MTNTEIWTVYAHINKSNNKIYIGITSQIPEKRWLNGKGYSYNSYFNNAIKKYGWDNFEHEIIANKLTEQEAKNFEKLLIAKFDLNNDSLGYNLTQGGDGIVGYHHTKETKEKLSQASKNMTKESRDKITQQLIGKKHSEEHKEKISIGAINKGTKQVCQYELDGTFVKKWDSLKDIHNDLGILESCISRCCSNKNNSLTTGNYMWRYFSDENTYKNNIEPYKDNFKRKIIVQLDKNNCVIKIWNSASEIQKTLDINISNIYAVCNGKKKYAGGYLWSYNCDNINN